MRRSRQIAVRQGRRRPTHRPSSSACASAASSRSPGGTDFASCRCTFLCRARACHRRHHRATFACRRLGGTETRLPSNPRPASPLRPQMHRLWRCCRKRSRSAAWQTGSCALSGAQRPAAGPSPATSSGREPARFLLPGAAAAACPDFRTRIPRGKRPGSIGEMIL